MSKIDVLRTEHVSGSDKFPIFVGFMTAGELDKYAQAPQFELTTPHEVIAGNINAVPVREWQRPIDPQRTEEIARIFKRSSEIMPNAVLLAAPDPSVVALKGLGGANWELQLTLHNGNKPLWILDGQHRISGLSQTKPDGDIPFVLLTSHGNSSQYQESSFAKIFAQVTTTAEGLHPLHDGWLTYAFRLGRYDPTSPNFATKNAQHVEAMEFVTNLCHRRYLNKAKTMANPFFDRVAFNPQSYKRTSPSPAAGPTSGGFEIDANEWEKVAFGSYYSKSLPAGKVSPDELAVEVGKAYGALVDTHKAAHRSDSVLLNAAGSAGAKGHKALQEGLLHGIFRYIAEHGAPGSWTDVFDERAFDTTDWRSSSWASASRSGTQGTINKQLAKSVFERLFATTLNDLFLPGMAVPVKLDLRRYFAGDIGWGLDVQGRRVGTGGRKLKFAGSSDPHVRLESGVAHAALDIGTLRMLSIGKVTPNVVSASVADVARPFDKHWSYQSVKAGTLLDSNIHLHANPISLRFDFTFYGGQSRYVELDVDWDS